MANHTLGTISIPSGCVWIDEFDWSPVESSQERSISGALIIDVASRLKGRPITLEASEDRGWNGMTRAVLSQLYALAATPGEHHSLTLADGREFTVMFRPGEEPITARPIAVRELPTSDWPYVITLRLTEV